MEILIIDDRYSKVIQLNYYLRQIFGDLLKLVHYKFPEEALKDLIPGRYKILFLDYMFEKPGDVLFGDDYIKRIKEIDKNIVIIMNTDIELDLNELKKKGAYNIIDLDDEKILKKLECIIKQSIN